MVPCYRYEFEIREGRFAAISDRWRLMSRPPASRRRTVAIQPGVAADLTSRTDWTNPVMDVSPTFRACLCR